MPSFDIVSEVDIHELTNAVDQANRELGTRFDFKGVDAAYVLERDPDLTSERGEAIRTLLYLHRRDEAIRFFDAWTRNGSDARFGADRLAPGVRHDGRDAPASPRSCLVVQESGDPRR